MNIPNILTIIRLMLIPVMAAFFMTNHILLALITYVIASITDVIDGFIARKFNMITDLGKILDPVADKLLQYIALLCLCYIKVIPAWIVIVFLAKEFLLGIGCIKLIKKDIYISAKWFGKLSTCIFFLAIIVATLSKLVDSIPPNYPLILMCFALIIGMFSLVMYILNYLKEIKKPNE
ncbi:MAG: CDP-alcohol phosphatidyltransferase family protein [Clostridia bacterium]|nr:CDP-alcohol phosphatidyltransferase family protein [Clostridia bacterium]